MIPEMPDRLLIGGCSFTDSPNNLQALKADPCGWVSNLVLKYPQIRFINNVAISGGGTHAMVQNLSYMLSGTNWFPPEKTLVLFDITGLERVDLMVSEQHPDRNDFSHVNITLPFAWITSGGWFGPDHIKDFRSPLTGLRTGHSKAMIDELQKNQEYEQVVLDNSLGVMNLIMSLAHRGYRYYFMIMDDQVLQDAPDFFQKFLDGQDQHWIKFDPYLSMFAYTRALSMLDTDQFHPSRQGHVKIAERIAQTVDHHFVELY